MRGWQRQFYVLDEGGLAWFASEEAATRQGAAKGRVPMRAIVGAEAAPSRGPSRFVLHVRSLRGESQRYIKLNAETPALMTQWIELVGRHLASHGLCSLTGLGLEPRLRAQHRERWLPVAPLHPCHRSRGR